MTQRARFAPAEATPIDQSRAREMADRVNDSAQLAAFIADACLTIDTLWTDNARLQDGTDRSLDLVAQARGELGRANARIRELESRLGASAATIDPEPVKRLRISIESARQKRFLAEPIDVGDLEALLAFVDAMGSGSSPSSNDFAQPTLEVR